MNYGQFSYLFFINNQILTGMFIFYIFARMEKVYQYYRDTIAAHTRRSDGLRKKNAFDRDNTPAAGCRAYCCDMVSERRKLDGVGRGNPLIHHSFHRVNGLSYILSSQKSYADALSALCNNELKGLDYDFSAFDGAPEKSSADHSFSLDLDLFGNRSIFQSINRTVTSMGKERLADWFINPLTDKEKDTQTTGSDP